MFDVLSHKCILDFLSCFLLSVSLGKCVKPYFCQRYLLLSYFKMSKVENELTYSCYVHSINFKLPFYICGCIGLLSKLIPSVRDCVSVYVSKGRKKNIIGSQPLGPSMFLLLGSFISRHIDF